MSYPKTKTSKRQILLLLLFFSVYTNAQDSKWYLSTNTESFIDMNRVCSLTVQSGQSNGVPINVVAVDLGLPSGTRWANMNVGASSPEEYGKYFAWGETSGKNTYTWDNYICSESICGKPGDPVYDLVGDKADIAGTKFDAATINWGASWNMPTAKQIEELASNCYSSLVTINDVPCRKLISRINGNEIIFPLSGARWFEDFAYEGSLGYYWASILRQGGYVSPARFIVRENSHGWGWSMGGENDRFCAFPIRPVFVENDITVVSLGTKVLMMDIGESIGLTYVFDPSSESEPSITWTTSNDDVAVVNTGGVVTAVSEGSCTVVVSCGGNIQDECLVVVDNTAGTSDGHDYVDLGLPSGTLWATTNLGAGSPEDDGLHYQWGSEEIGELSTDKDAADNSWGAYWRTPSRAQIEELVNSSFTTITQSSMNGVDGFLITSLINDKCIFLPAKSNQDDGNTLEGCYWSRSSYNSTQVYELILTSKLQASCVPADRSNALPVRPVYEGIVTSSGIVVSSGELNFGTVAIGSSRSLSFEIWNNTFEQKEILPFSLNNADFSIDWNGGELEPHAKQLVTVTYSPTTTTIATGGLLSIGTVSDSTPVSVFASSHKGHSYLTTKRNLVVWGKDGSKTTFVLNKKPVVTVADGIIKVESTTTSAEFIFNDILKLTYEGIVDPSASLNDIEMKTFEQSNDALTFYSDCEDLYVQIVSLSGVIVKQFTVKQGLTFSLPLNQFSAGVYVTNVNEISYKIAIR